MRTLPSPEFLQLVYRPELGVLVGRWLQPLTTEELQAGYHLMLEAAAELQCRFWLVDGRRRTHAHSSDSRWMMETFFPQLATRLGGQTYLGYLFTPAHLNDLETDTNLPSLNYFDNRPYQVRRFIEEQVAMQWLAHCRALQLATAPVLQG
ncbi:hypothetical protein [Solirubrum puertoriconensis]|uniref:Uncharacterized protein n=1 Tax=Solirubrum puertoriconensis TaxID=1751427 RepID=A0A9X0HPW7_SOLP1|nr:hypothetical protein [Solirubrum puertoriconensis]KUG09950.1 hypothetical protein ASU33_20600 [Solirubrum puertoriconensis]